MASSGSSLLTPVYEHKIFTTQCSEQRLRMIAAVLLFLFTSRSQTVPLTTQNYLSLKIIGAPVFLWPPVLCDINNPCKKAITLNLIIHNQKVLCSMS